MYRYSLTGYDKLGSLQSKQSTVDSDEATVSATRTITPANRPAAVDIPDEFTLGSLSYMAASPDYLMPSFRRFGMSRFSILGTLQSKPATVDCDEATVSQARTITPANRPAGVDIPSEFTLGSVSYMAASPDYLMPSFRRFGRTRYSVVDVPHSMTSSANINAVGGYTEGRSYAVPDITGIISVAFEEVV